MKKKKNYYLRLGAALLLLCNPNIHIVDILPDFIAYFLIFSIISEAADLAPHFAQARDACKKLAILGLLKIPASFLILLARSHSTIDSNLIPTFAIIFAIFDMILGCTLIYRASEALFYLGERSDASALISPFYITNPKAITEASRSAFRRSRQPEELRTLSYFFLFIKCCASFLPELLLLTRKQEYVGDFQGQTALLRLYPYVLILALVLTLSVGIYWFILSFAYLRSVRTEGKFLFALQTLAGEELIKKKEQHALCSAHVLGFSLLAIATLFSLNFMPIFCYALFLMLGASWLHTTKTLRRCVRAFGILSILSSLVQALMLEVFEYDHGYKSLFSDLEAQQAYVPCVIAAAINSALILALVISVFFSLRHTTIYTLGISPSSERYGPAQRKYHAELSRFNLIFLVFGILSTVCRGIYVYLRGQVVFVPSSIVATAGAFSHKLEFWPLILVGIAIPYIIFGFYYMGIMKEEIALTLDEE